MNTNKTQFLHRIRLRKFTTDTPLEDKYNIEKFRPDDAILAHKVIRTVLPGKQNLICYL